MMPAFCASSLNRELRPSGHFQTARTKERYRSLAGGWFTLCFNACKSVQLTTFLYSIGYV